MKNKSFWFDSVLVSLIIVVFGLLPARKWLRLFPLVEFRSKVYFNLQLSWLWENWTFRGQNIWSSSFFFDSWIGRQCEFGIPCLNTLPLVINLLTVLAIYIGTRMFLRKRVLAVFCCIFWLLSMPYLDTLAWQALSLDKIAAMTVVIGSILAFLFYRSAYSIKKVAFANFVFLLCVLIGYNSKPSAWVLIPGLWLFPMVGRGLRVKEWSHYLVIPSIYGIAQNVFTFNRIRADKFYYDHTSNGNPIHNLNAFVGILFGSPTENLISKIIFVFVISAIVAGLFMKQEIARFGFWCCTMVGGGLLISARTTYASPFYMLVSQVFYAWAMCVAVLVIATFAKNVWNNSLYLEIVLLTLILSLFYPVVHDTNILYDSVLIQSDNFRESFVQLDQVTKESRKNKLKFVLEEIMDYRYVDGPPIAVFISSTFSISDGNISWVTKDKVDMSVLDPDTIYVNYDGNMNISSTFTS